MGKANRFCPDRRRGTCRSRRKYGTHERSRVPGAYAAARLPSGVPCCHRPRRMRLKGVSGRSGLRPGPAIRPAVASRRTTVIVAVAAERRTGMRRPSASLPRTRAGARRHRIGLSAGYRISFLQQPREGSAHARSDRSLKLGRQIREGRVRMNGVKIAQQGVWKPLGCGLERGDRIDDSGEDNLLHHVGC